MFWIKMALAVCLTILLFSLPFLLIFQFSPKAAIIASFLWLMLALASCCSLGRKLKTMGEDYPECRR